MLKAEKKLVIAAVAVACVTGYMAYLGGSTTWQYYLTVEECQADGPSLLGKRARVNGTVAPGSLHIAKGPESTVFSLKGTKQDLRVVFSETLPDNLTEGMQVVVEGEFQRGGWFQGEHVMTRCASKYQARSGLARATPPAGHENAR